MGWPLPPGGAGVSNPIHKSSTKFFYRAFGGSVCGETSAVGVALLLHGGVAYWGEGKKREDGGGTENTGFPWLKKHAGGILVGFAVGLLLREFFRSYVLRVFVVLVLSSLEAAGVRATLDIHFSRASSTCMLLLLFVCAIDRARPVLFVNLATVCCVLLMQRDMFARGRWGGINRNIMDPRVRRPGRASPELSCGGDWFRRVLRRMFYCSWPVCCARRSLYVAWHVCGSMFSLRVRPVLLGDRFIKTFFVRGLWFCFVRQLFARSFSHR